MEDDDEIQSHLSPGSRSPASPRPVGRITVTVAAAPPPPPQQHSPSPLPPPQNALTLALPIQQVRNGGGGGGREDCWSEAATAVLVEAWGERYLELSRGNLKQKHWKEVADIVNSREDYRKTPKTDIQCKNRIDTVKKKYKLEKAKAASGGGPSKWPFFDRLEHLIGPTAKTTPGSNVAALANHASSSSAALKVPVGIPVGVRGGSQFVRSHHEFQAKRRAQPPLPPPPPLPVAATDCGNDDDDDDDESDASPAVSTDSEGNARRKRPRTVREMNVNMNSMMNPRGGEKSKKKGGGGGGGGWGGAVKELTRAILKFGEAYEKAESSKIQQVVEMEKQRMKFAKELELQRMQFFMKTQLEISQLKHGNGNGNGNGGGSRRGNASNHHNHSNNNNNDNNSDSSN